MLYQKIEILVNENKLRFNCNHKTHSKAMLQRNEKEWFLEEIGENAGWKDSLILPSEFCFACGKYIDYYLKGEELVPSISDCFDEKEVVVTIPVPNGELLFDDWFEHATEVIGHLDDRTVNINTTINQVKRMKDYADEGIGHFFCGTSPSVYQQEDGDILIGNPSYEDDDYDNDEIPLVENATELGSVSTDLRWVTVCDRSIYESIAIKKLGEEKGKLFARLAAAKTDVVVQVAPGDYELRYFIDVKKEHMLFASFKKIDNI